MARRSPFVSAALGLSLLAPAALAGPSYLEEFDGRTVDEFGVAHTTLSPGWASEFPPDQDADCARPVIGDNLSAARVKPAGWRDDTVGGDYLRAPYPIGISDGAHRQWWGNLDRRWDEAQPWGGTHASCVGAIYSLGPLDPGYTPAHAITLGHDPEQRYLSFLIGGAPTGGAVSVTWVPGCAPGSVNGSGCGFPVARPLLVYEYGSLAEVPPGPTEPPHGARREAYAVPEQQQMRQVIWDTWAHDCSGLGLGPFVCPYPEGTVISVRVDAEVAGIHVDRVMVSSAEDLQPTPYGSVGPDAVIPAPLWGFADLHTHWLNHMSNGARPYHLDDDTGGWTSDEAFKTVLPHLWGSPWASGATEEEQLEAAIPVCDRQGHSGVASDGRRYVRTHAGGNALLSTMNANDGSAKDYDFTWRHGNNGHTGTAYQLPPYPFFTVTLQQMFYAWVRRARDGGLRLMVTDVGWSGAAELLLSNWSTQLRRFVATDDDYNAASGTTPAISESTDYRAAFGYSRDTRAHVESQVCATLKLLEVPEIRDFAEAAYTPAQARRIIAEGKIAVVLGSEMDNHGRIRGFSAPADEISWLRDLGIRKLAPVHIVDNHLGGAAAYEGLFAAYNDAMDLPHDMVGALCLRSDDPAGHLSSPDVWRRRHFKWLAYEPGDQDDAGFVDGTPTGVPEGTLRCQLTWDRLNFGHYGGDDLHHDHDGDGVANVFDPDWTGDDDFDGDVDTWANAKHTPPNFYDVEEACPQSAGPGFDPLDGECISFQLFPWKYNPIYLPSYLGAEPQRAVINETDVVTTQYGLRANLEGDIHPFETTRWSNYPAAFGDPDVPFGHRNARGLQALGEQYVLELMRRGMIVDVSHAGDKTAASILGAEPRAPGDASFAGLIWDAAQGCTGADPAAILRPECQRSAYPIVATHGTFRALRQTRAEAPDEPGRWASERDVSTRQYRRILASGGVVGLGAGFTAARPVASSGASGSCLGSTKSFSQAYAFALDEMEALQAAGDVLVDPRGALPAFWGLRGVALGTDLNGFAEQTGPRFGHAGCKRHAEGDAERDAQRLEHNGVRYDVVPHPGSSEAYWMPPGESAALELLQVETPTGHLPVELVGDVLWKVSYAGFDFNELGLVSYGLLPDFLQDVVNGAYDAGAGVDRRPALRQRLRYLYRGAEDFIRAWERSIESCERYLDPADPSDDHLCDPPVTSSLDPETCNAWVNMESILGEGTATASEALTSVDPSSSCDARCGDALVCGDGGCCSCAPDCVEQGTCCGDFQASCAAELSCAGSCDLDCAADPTTPCCNDFDAVCAPSCEGQCGGSSANSEMHCYCDAACTRAGDCCPDFEATCAPWDGSCSSGSCTGLGDNGLCRCSADCVDEGDCCGDYVEACHATPPGAGSCYADCGGVSSDGGCYCDPLCEEYGDCCWDRELWCPGGASPSGGTCDGSCGGVDDTGTCYCDAACVQYGDCCADYAGFCLLPSCDDATGSAWPVTCDVTLSNQYGSCACDAAPGAGCDLRGDCCPDAFGTCGI